MTTKKNLCRTKLSEIWFDQEGVLWLKPQDNADLDLEEVEACFGKYHEMGIGRENKVFQIIDARTVFQMSREARDYAAANGAEFFVASAIISSNLSVRLMVNFFNMFYRTQIVPFKLFDTEENAREWLAAFRK